MFLFDVGSLLQSSAASATPLYGAFSDAAVGSTRPEYFIEGDSISAQGITSTTTLNAIGFHNALNAISGNAFYYPFAENFAVGGGTLTTMESEKVTQLGSATASILHLLGGANDVGVTTPDLATMQTKWTSIKDYVISTLGKRMIAYTIMPRTQDLGVALTSTQLTALKDFNEWLLAQHNPTGGLICINIYDALCSATDTPNPDYFKNESGKLLHPNPAGSLAAAKTAWAYLQTLGFVALPNPDPVTGNLFTYGAMTGTGGTLSTNASGSVVDGFTLSGSGGTQPRTGSVGSDGQRIVWNPISGDGASANVKLTGSSVLKSGGSYDVGDTVYGWALVTINNASRMDGPYVQLTDVGSSSTAYVGFNKAGVSTGFMPSDAGTLLMTTRRFTVASGNTSLKPEVICQAECSANAGVVDFTVKSMGIVKVV